MYRSFLGSIAVSLLLMWAGCTRTGGGAGDAQQVLKDYISRSFEIKAVGDRKVLESFLGGDAKIRLTALSDQEFEEQFVNKKRQFVRLAIKETQPVGSDELNVTYELSYLDPSKGQDARVTNKKICVMSRASGQWRIHSVKNLKEMVDFQEELSLP